MRGRGRVSLWQLRWLLTENADPEMVRTTAKIAARGSIDDCHTLLDLEDLNYGDVQVWGMYFVQDLVDAFL